MVSCQTWFHVKIKKIKFFKIIFISFHDGTMPEIKKLGRSTDGGGWGMKFFKIILFEHGTTA